MGKMMLSNNSFLKDYLTPTFWAMEWSLYFVSLPGKAPNFFIILGYEHQTPI